MKAIGFFLCLAAVAFLAMFSSEFRLHDMLTVVDEFTLYYFLIVMLGTTLSSFGFKTLISGINGALSKKYQMTDKQQADALGLFTLLKSTMIYAAVISICIEFILLLLNLDDPATFGPKVAVSLNAALYGAAINMLIINPIIHVLKNKTSGEASAVPERVKDKEAADKLLRLCFEKGITREEIMNADEINLRRFQ